MAQDNTNVEFKHYSRFQASKILKCRVSKIDEAIAAGKLKLNALGRIPHLSLVKYNNSSVVELKNSRFAIGNRKRKSK